MLPKLYWFANLQNNLAKTVVATERAQVVPLQPRPFLSLGRLNENISSVVPLTFTVPVVCPPTSGILIIPSTFFLTVFWRDKRVCRRGIAPFLPGGAISPVRHCSCRLSRIITPLHIWPFVQLAPVSLAPLETWRHFVNTEGLPFRRH